MPTNPRRAVDVDVRSRPSAECKLLVATAGRNLFQDNVWRITGLPVDASAREIAKHGDRLKIMEELGGKESQHSGLFARQPPPTLDELRDALQRIKNPERRLVDEFFWFWPEDSQPDHTDAAIQAVKNGDAKSAVSVWREREAQGLNPFVATHNLAVAHLMIALDQENKAVGHGIVEDRRTNTDGHWTSALKRWHRLLDENLFWNGVSARIRELNEPSLPPSYAEQLRRSLLVALAKIHAELAISYVEKAQIAYAQIHVALLNQTSRGTEAGSIAAALVLKPSGIRLKQQIKRAREVTSKNAAEAPGAARELLRHARMAFPHYDLLQSTNHLDHTELFNEVAETCYQLQITYYNKTSKDDETCLEILELALPYATNPETKKHIEEDINGSKKRLSDKKFMPFYAALETIRNSSEAPLLRMQRFHAKVAPLLTLAEAESGRTDPAFMQLLDDTAYALRAISTDAWNRFNDLATALAAAEVARKFVCGAEARKFLEADRVKLAGFVAAQTQAANARRAADKKSAHNQTIFWLVVIGIVVAIAIITNLSSETKSSQTGSRPSPSQSYSPPSPYSPPISPATSSSPSGRTYSVPSYLTAELSRDGDAIASAKAEVNVLRTSLDALESSLKQKSASMDNTNEYEVESYNSDVRQYNDLLAIVRAKEARVSQLVDSYNEKLEKYGR